MVSNYSRCIVLGSGTAYLGTALSIPHRAIELAVIAYWRLTYLPRGACLDISMSCQMKIKQKTIISTETKTIFMVFMDDPSCMLTRMPADNLQMIPSPHSSVRDSEKKSEANKFFFQLLWFSKRETEKKYANKKKTGKIKM